MSKCAWNKNSKLAIQAKVIEIIEDNYDNESIIIPTIRNQIILGYAYTPELITWLPDFVKNTMEAYGLSVMEDISFNPKPFPSITENTEDNTTAILEKKLLPGEIEELKPTYQIDYLLPFVISPRTYEKALQEIRNQMCNTFIFNREYGYTVNKAYLTNSIRENQKLLFSDILSDLLILGKDVAYTLLFNDNNDYTGVFDTFKNDYGSFLTPTATLSVILNNADYNNSLRDKFLIDAYIKYMILNNYPSIVHDFFNKAVDIDDTTMDFAPNKYKFIDRGTSVYTTWRTSDIIELRKETGKIVLLLLTTSPMYRFGLLVAMTDTYLNFSSFINTILKLKAFSDNVLAYDTDSFTNIKLSLDVTALERLELNKFSSIGELINSIPLNPQRNLYLLFNIICNKYDDVFGENLYFTFYDKDVLYTVFKNFFDSSHNSLYTASIGSLNWYSYLTLFMTTMSGVNYVLWVETDDGITVREMGKDLLSRLRSTVSLVLNNKLYLLSLNEINGGLPITIVAPNKIKFTLNDNPDIEYTVSIEPGQQELLSILMGGQKITLPSLDPWGWVRDNCNSLLKNMLDVDLNDPRISEIVISSFNKSVDEPYNLLQLASVALFRTVLNKQQYSDNKLLMDPNESKSVITTRLDAIYGYNVGKTLLNLKLGAWVDIIPKSGRNYTTFSKLITAKAYLTGLSTAITVTDGSGNMISRENLNSLDSLYRTLWLLLKNSPCAKFGILQRNVFLGVSNLREFVTKNGEVKKFINFTPAEMFTGMFVYNFLNNLNTSGVISLIGAVNSDKPRTDFININLNADVNGTTYLNILNSENWRPRFIEIINQQLGNYYTLSQDNIMNDYRAVLGLDLNGYTQENMNIINDMAEKLKMSGYDYIMSKVNAYNNTHPSPITFIDQLHYINKDGSLYINYSFKNAGDIANNANRTDQYMHDCELLLVLDLINDDVRIDATDSMWATPSGYMAYAIVTTENGTYKIGQKNDYVAITEKVKHIDVNPLISKYVILDYLFTTLWRYSTVGSHFTHPNKNKTTPFIIRTVLDDADLLRYTPHYIDGSYTRQGRINRVNELWHGLLLYYIKDTQTEKYSLYYITEDKKKIPLSLTRDTLKELVLDTPLFLVDNDEKAREWNPAAISQWELFKNRAVNEGKVLLVITLSEEYPLVTTQKELDKLKKKALDGIVSDEAQRYNALHKRNVAFTATMHLFQLNQLDGMPDTYNIAVLKDVNDTLYNITGVIDSSVKPYDGVTFANPFISYLENNSLDGAKVGINKKIFVHFYTPAIGSGGIIKTAAFSLTNKLIRDSYFYRRMMRNMTDRPWDMNIDITAPNWQHQVVDPSTIIYVLDGIRYLINNILRISDYTYDIELSIISDYQGVEQTGIHQTVIINSNYTLWKALGGENTVEWNPDMLAYQPSESSIVKTVEYINNIGFPKNNNVPIYDTLLTQEEIYQPLKHSDIHYMPTSGAVKQGGGNINENSIYDTDDDIGYGNPQKVNFMPIKMLQAGIQLDKEHSADNESVSLMTLVCSACAAMGYTREDANRLYEGIASLVDNNLQKVSSETVLDIIINNLNSLKVDSASLLSLIVSDINANLNTRDIPFSDPRIALQLTSIINVAVTNACIKIKLPGVLAVLCPSYNIRMLYGNKLLHQLQDTGDSYRYGKNTDLDKLQAEYDAHPLYSETVDDIYRIEAGRWYTILNKMLDTAIIFISHPFWQEGLYMGRQTLLDKIRSGEITKVTEYIKNGRNLRNYNVFFRSGLGGKYLLYDLDAVKDLYNKRGSRAALQEELLRLKNGGSVRVNGLVLSDIQIIEEMPAEIILPKTMKTKMGLDNNDELSDVLEDPDFFSKKILNNITTRTLQYDIVLLRPNGNNTYLSSSVPTNATKVNIRTLYDYDNDCLYRIDTNGNRLYQLSLTELDHSKTNDMVYKIYDDVYAKALEIIVTDNFDHYLKTMNYALSLKKGERINYDELSLLGARMYASFQKVLNVIAARIPAQSMLSFMPMRIAAFDNADINTAYVSTSQIWLLGSDYDYDAVTVTGFELADNGLYYTWSPLANIDSFELLKASDTLPFPTGNEIILSHDDNAPRYDLNIKDIVSVGNNGNYKIRNNSPERIRQLSEIINYLNSNKAYNINAIGDTDNTLLSFLVTLVNRHNTYIKHLDSKRLMGATVNFINTKMFDIAINPINLIEASTPIDKATGIIKNIIPETQNLLLPGNVAVKIHAIRENQIGKAGVGICALGLKSFFAATLAYNNIVSTQRGLTRFNIPIHYREGQKQITATYTSIANLNGDDPDHDAAIELSAMLSLATDNAKELALAKLNAGTNTLGLYLFGISIGVPVNALYQIMTSPAVMTATQLASSNMFIGQKALNFYDLEDFIFNSGPYKLMPKTRDAVRVYNKIASDLEYAVAEEEDVLLVLCSALAHGLITMELLQAMRKPDNALLNRIIDQFIDYLLKKLSMSAPEMSDFMMLYKGAQEMRLLGTILSVNTGLKTATADFLNFMKQIKDMLRISARERNNEQVNLHSFITDKTYRDHIIDKYEKIKTAFNIPLILAYHPLFFAYLKAVDTADSYNKVSARYRVLSRYIQPLNISDQRQWSTRINKQVTQLIFNQFCLLNNIKFKVPKGSRIYTGLGELSKPLVNNTDILLGTFNGNASFKYWMEHTVIPQLKLGKNSLVANNEFINSLSPMLLTDTLTFTNSIMLSLPINMLPRDENDQIIFDNMQLSFLDLQPTYDGNGKYWNVDGKTLNILDLFFIYNMITTQMTLGEHKLSSIFSKNKNFGLLALFLRFETLFDNNQDIRFSDRMEKALSVLRGNPSTSRSRYIIAPARDQFKNNIYVRARNAGYTLDRAVQTDNDHLSIDPGMDTIQREVDIKNSNILPDGRYNIETQQIDTIIKELTISNENGALILIKNNNMTFNNKNYPVPDNLIFTYKTSKNSVIPDYNSILTQLETLINC